MNNIYELVDATDADAYYPLGLYTDVKKAVEDAMHGDSPCLDCEDFVRLEIRERALGFSGQYRNGKAVAIVRWERLYDEESDGAWGKPQLEWKLLPEVRKGELPVNSTETEPDGYEPYVAGIYPYKRSTMEWMKTRRDFDAGKARGKWEATQYKYETANGAYGSKAGSKARYDCRSYNAGFRAARELKEGE